MSPAEDDPGSAGGTDRGEAGADTDMTGFLGSAGGTEASGLHALLVEGVQDYAIFALDPRGRILSWNQGARRLKGYQPEEIIGRHFSVFYPPEDIAAGKPERELEEAIANGWVEDEGWRIRKDGSRFWASVVITTLRDASGSIVGFAKVTRDLTERRRAEEALRATEERFRLLIEAVKDYAIMMLDPEGNVASWNAGAEAILGYTADEIIGRHFSAFYPASDVAEGRPVRELEVALDEGEYEEEGWRVRKDGTTFWSSIVVTPVRTAAGGLIGFAKVTRDLTERRAAEERAIADARRITRIETASRTKSEFLSALSHELRTPINATLGYADLIDLEVDGPISDKQKDYLGRIRASQNHLLGLINDLLNYGRIESGRVEFHLAEVSLDEVIKQVLPMVSPQATSKKLAIERDRAQEDADAYADRARVEQIILNLLANAVKFTPAGGRIRIGVRADAGRVSASVSDNGPGVPPDQQQAIFEPFVQVGRSLSGGHEGTGLGLAISRELARGMGGDVTVKSNGKDGARFTLTLPAAGTG